MRRRHPPRLWMMTDERQGESLWGALEALPRGAGIIFRHYELSPGPRRALFRRVRSVARRRRQMLLLAGPPRMARAWGADGSHGVMSTRIRGQFLSAPAHDLAELRKAERAGADLIFLSPVFATRSHPGGAVLGPERFAMLARQSRRPVIALGGMNPQRARSLASCAYGWAAVDFWGAANSGIREGS